MKTGKQQETEYPRKFTFLSNIGGADIEETVEFKDKQSLEKGLDKRFGKNSPFHGLLIPKSKRKKAPWRL